jgi:DNA repair exonuclease SbcCD ATPase subunit
MQEYSYGLLRIILIDSFLPKRKYEVDISGNTNITGDNGLGKTSLIKLPIIFYGAIPTDVNIKENKETNYKGFSGRYLPRDGSYVVFEYVAQNQKKCVVFLPDSNSKEGICRYFIDSPYRHELFFENEGDSPHSRSAFLQQLELKDIAKYKPKSFTEYRAILLDGTQTRQLQFSMVPRGARLSKLHSLFTGMLNRSADFSVLGRIISDWAHSDIPRDATEALEKFKLDKTQLKSWLNDYRSQSLFNKTVSSVGLEKLQENYEQLKESSAQLIETRRYAHNRGRLLEETLKNKKLQIEQSQKILKGEAEAINELYSEANDEYETEARENSRLTTEIITLESQYTSYTKKLGVDYKTKLSQLSKYSEEKPQLEEQLSSLNSTSSNIKADFDRLISDAELSHAQLISKFEKELSDAELELATNTNQINLEETNKFSELEKINQKRKDILNKKNSKYEIKQIQLESTISNPVISRELTAILESADEAYEEVSTAREKLQDKTDAIESAYNKALLTFDKLNKEIDHVGRELDEVTAELGDVQAALNAHDDSLLAFLDKNVQDWHRTFGKVLTQKALLNRKLNPEVVDTNKNHNTVFGLSLDVNAIPDSDAFDIDILTEREKILLEEQTKLESKIEQLDKALYLANKARLDAIKNTELHNQEKRQIKRDLANRKTNRDNARLEVERAKKKMIAEAGADSDELKKLLIPSLESEYEQLNEVYEQTLEAINDEKEKRISSANESLKNTKNRLAEEICSANEGAEKRIGELKDQRNEKLSEAGIDASLVSMIETQIKKITTKIAELTRIKQTYAAFEEFKAEDYSAYEQLTFDKKSSGQALIMKEQHKTDLYRALQKKRDDLGELEIELLKAQQDAESALSKYHFIINDASQYELSNIDNMHVDFDEKLSAMDIKRRYENYKETYITTKKLLADNLSHFREFFNRDLVKGTPIYDYWITHDHREERLLTTALVVISYVIDGNQDNDVRSLKHNLNQLDKLNSFVTYISNFANKMTYFNQQLDKHMEQVTEFDSLKSLTTNLQFTLSNESAYKDMKELSDNYTRYKESERGTFSLGDLAKPGLPPEWLFSSIEDFI